MLASSAASSALLPASLVPLGRRAVLAAPAAAALSAFGAPRAARADSAFLQSLRAAESDLAASDGSTVLGSINALLELATDYSGMPSDELRKELMERVLAKRAALKAQGGWDEGSYGEKEEQFLRLQRAVDPWRVTELQGPASLAILGFGPVYLGLLAVQVPPPTLAVRLSPRETAALPLSPSDALAAPRPQALQRRVHGRRGGPLRTSPLRHPVWMKYSCTRALSRWRAQTRWLLFLHGKHGRWIEKAERHIFHNRGTFDFATAKEMRAVLAAAPPAVAGVASRVSPVSVATPTRGRPKCEEPKRAKRADP